MPEPSDPGDWKPLAALLIAQRDEEERTWGPADDLVIANYLSGACSPDEQRRVEEWMRTYPAVADLVKLVRESLAGAPRVAPDGARPPKPSGAWTAISTTAARLNAQLAAWLDAAGELATTGLAACLAPEPAPALGRAMNDSPQRSRSWEIPLTPTSHVLHIHLAPAAGGSWSVTLQTIPPLANARIELSRAGESAELSDGLDRWEQRPLPLDEGRWLLELRTATHSWEVPFVLGQASS